MPVVDFTTAGPIPFDIALAADFDSAVFVLTEGPTTLATIAGDVRSFDLESLGLAEGDHELELRRRDRYGRLSEPLTLSVRVTGGEVEALPWPPGQLSTQVRPAGVVRVGWVVTSGMAGTVPAEAHVADAADPDTVLATVPWAGAIASVDVGPFADGTTVRPLVRTEDSTGRRSAWYAAPVVVADAEGPAAPVRVNL